MKTLLDTLLHIDLLTLFTTFGYIGLFAIVFAESGLFFGFFLPGDSLLFTAGLLASQGLMNIAPLVLVVVSAAILGDTVGYWFGKKVGTKIFSREDSWFFHKRHIQEAKEFYEKNGVYAIVLARFIPIVRTFAPIVAGVGSMNYSLFVRYNIIGGLVWGAGVTLLGYFLGSAFPQTEKYLLPIILGIILLSCVPLLFQLGKKKKAYC